MLRPFARAPHVKIDCDPPAFRGGRPSAEESAAQAILSLAAWLRANAKRL